MNRAEINKILDDLEFIEDYCKKNYEPKFEIEFVPIQDRYGQISFEFRGFNIEYVEEGGVCFYFFKKVRKGNFGSSVGIVRWGTFELDEDECLDENLTNSNEDGTVNLLKILEYVVKKMKNNEFTLESEYCII